MSSLSTSTATPRGDSPPSGKDFQIWRDDVNGRVRYHARSLTQ